MACSQITLSNLVTVIMEYFLHCWMVLVEWQEGHLTCKKNEECCDLSHC